LAARGRAASGFDRLPSAQPRRRLDRRDDVGAIEHQAAGRQVAAEDLAQHLAVAAAEIDDQRRRREVVRRGNGAVPIVAEVRHERVESARLVGVLAQVREATGVPGDLMRHRADERRVERAPGLP
jgi:hypothetical protein